MNNVENLKNDNDGFKNKYASELQKISPEMKSNKKFEKLLHEAEIFMSNCFSPSWINRFGEIKHSELDPDDYFFHVSEDGKTLKYGYSKSNPDAIQNGYNKQFISYIIEIKLDKYDNLVVTSKGGSYDEDTENKNTQKNTFMSYNGKVYDSNGNMIKNTYIDKVTSMSCPDLETFINNVDIHHCPDFGDLFRPLNSVNAGQFANTATAAYSYKMVERNMSNPSVVHYINANRKDGRNFDVTYFSYPESFWTVQLNTESPDELSYIPSILEEDMYESPNGELYERARKAEEVIKNNLKEMYL